MTHTADVPVRLTAEHFDIRPLGTAEVEHLRGFPCRQFKQAGTDVVEGMVRNDLPDALLAGTAEATGLWVGEQLVAVAAWRYEAHSAGTICRSILIAVRRGYVRRGCGSRLKSQLVTIARASGCVAVASEVHRDTDAMLHINEQHGARLSKSTPDGTYLACVIPL